MCGLLSFPDATARFRSLGDIHGGKIQVAQYSVQQIVEVMGNPAGHDAEAIQLLGMLHLFLEMPPLFFGPFAVSKVAVAGALPNPAAIPSIDGLAGVGDPTLLALAM